MSENEQELIRLALERAAKIAAETAAKTAIATYQSEVDKNNKSRNDRRLKNTKLLLSNYREFKEFVKNAIYSKEQITETIDLIDLMWDPYDRQDVLLESIKTSKVRTMTIIKHIDEMLEIYQTMCMTSKNEADQRRYGILYDSYISDEKYTIEEIADKYNVDTRTAYRDRKFAIDKVAKLIFGIDYLK